MDFNKNSKSENIHILGLRIFVEIQNFVSKYQNTNTLSSIWLYIILLYALIPSIDFRHAIYNSSQYKWPLFLSLQASGPRKEGPHLHWQDIRWSPYHNVYPLSLVIRSLSPKHSVEKQWSGDTLIYWTCPNFEYS